MSGFISIKKLKKRNALGETQEFFAVPSMALSTPQGRMLIPNPSGAEAALFDTLEEAEEAVRRAGFDYEFEGQKTYAFSQPATTKGKARPATSGNPLDQAIPLLTQHLKDRESSVVANAVFALGSVRAYAALDELIGILGHDDPNVRKNLAEALARLGSGALPKLTAAYEQARSSTGKQAPYIRLTVLNTFLEMLEQGVGTAYCGQFLPVAISGLEDDSWLVRSQAALVVGHTAQALEEERKRAEQQR